MKRAAIRELTNGAYWSVIKKAPDHVHHGVNQRGEFIPFKEVAIHMIMN
jgi:hypothetical protein